MRERHRESRESSSSLDILGLGSVKEGLWKKGEGKKERICHFLFVADCAIN